MSQLPTSSGFFFQPSAERAGTPGAPVLSSQWVPLGTAMRPPAPTSQAATQLSSDQRGSEGAAGEACKPAGVDRLGSQQAGARVAGGAAVDGEGAARKGRKRERPAGEAVDDSRWTLKRKLAALSQDIETLTQEVARVRQAADASCMHPMLSLEEKAMLAEKHAKKRADAQRRGISVILRDIMIHKFANPFLKPVDAKLYPEYPLKIKNPMDFTTIKSRMDAGAYLNNVDAFLADMNLLFDNAFVYNLPGQPVHEWAVTLKEKFDERMKNLNARVAGLEGEQAKEEEDALDVAKRRLQERAWQQLAVQRSLLEPHLAAAEARVKDLRAEAAAGCGYVSLPEKHALMKALEELKAEDFEQAMQIIVNRHPGLLQSSEEDMLDINFDPLDSLTLRQLSAFCNFCRKAQNPDSPTCWPGLLFGTGARDPASKQTQSTVDGVGSRTGSGGAHAASTSTPAPGLGTNAQRGSISSLEGEESRAMQQAAANKNVQPLREVGERSWSILATQQGKRNQLMRVLSGSIGPTPIAEDASKDGSKESEAGPSLASWIEPKPKES